jgi:membrane protein
VIKPGALLSAVRRKRPFVDHVVRAYGRYQADTGNRLAAAVTFYWFLSLFPILLIAVYFTSKALGSDAGAEITDGLGPYLGDPTAKAIGEVVQENAGKAGLIGLGGTLLSGLGWIEALREAIRSMWHQNVLAGNLVTRKVADVIALVGLFAVIGASVVVTGATTAASDQVLDLLDLQGTSGAKTFTIVLSFALATFVDLFVFLYLFVRLAKVPTPVRPILRGALFGAVSFEVLKLFAAFYIGRTTSKGEATYGTFAVVVGLLLFLNLVSRLVLVTAAFIVTAPYDDDVRPSGTADKAQASKAGIPAAFAGTDLNLQEDGAPTPLVGAVQGKVGAMEQSWSAKTRPEPVAEPSVAPAADLPAGAAKVQTAATITAAAGGALVAAVAVYGLRTLQGIVRR